MKDVYHILMIEGLEVDSLGNYVDYIGIEDNVITKEDDFLVAQSKIFAQEEWLVQNGYTSMDMLGYKDMLEYMDEYEYNRFQYPLSEDH